MSRPVDDIIAVGRVLFEMGLVDSHAGNLSLREGEGVWATRSGCRLGFLQPPDVLYSSALDQPADGSTSEWIIHQRIYEATSARAIVHCHPPHANALALHRSTIEPLDTEAEMLTGSIPVVAPDNPVASEEAAVVVISALQKGATSVLVRRHGVFAVADTLDLALARASATNYAAHLIILAGQVAKQI